MGFIFGVQHGVTSALLVVHLERFGRHHHESIVATSAEDVKLKKLKALMKSRGPAAQSRFHQNSRFHMLSLHVLKPVGKHDCNLVDLQPASVWVVTLGCLETCLLRLLSGGMNVNSFERVSVSWKPGFFSSFSYWILSLNC